MEAGAQHARAPDNALASCGGAGLAVIPAHWGGNWEDHSAIGCERARLWDGSLLGDSLPRAGDREAQNRSSPGRGSSRHSQAGGASRSPPRERGPASTPSPSLGPLAGAWGSGRLPACSLSCSSASQETPGRQAQMGPAGRPSAHARSPLPTAWPQGSHPRPGAAAGPGQRSLQSARSTGPGPALLPPQSAGQPAAVRGGGGPGSQRLGAVVPSEPRL